MPDSGMRIEYFRVKADAMQSVGVDEIGWHVHESRQQVTGVELSFYILQPGD